MKHTNFFARLFTAAVLLAAVLCLGGCSTAAAQAEPPAAETSRSEEATPETAMPEATPAPTATPEPAPAVVLPTGVTLEQEGGILNSGMTWALHATVLPEDAADKTLIWSSSDEGVAVIDDSGLITAKAPGQTTITAASEAGGVSATYNLIVREVVKCSYCGATGHTADNCPTAARAAAQQAAAEQAAAQAAADTAAQAVQEQPAAEPSQPAEQAPAQDYEVDWAGRRIYSYGEADIPEGGVVQRPDGTRYIKGPRNVIFGYDSCPEDNDPSLPGNTPFTGDCVFCGDDGHDVYHCPILDAQENPDAFFIDN